MTRAIRGTNTKKHYQGLGLEPLQNNRKFRCLCLFYKIYKDHSPPYFHNLILTDFISPYSFRAT